MANVNALPAGGRALRVTTLTLGTAALWAMSALVETTDIASGLPAQDTVIEIPINAVVLAICTKVITQPGGTLTFSVRGAQSNRQFSTTDVSTEAGSTDPGTNGCPAFSGQAEAVRYVFDADPTDDLGRIATTIFYYTVTP